MPTHLRLKNAASLPLLQRREDVSGDDDRDSQPLVECQMLSESNIPARAASTGFLMNTPKNRWGVIIAAALRRCSSLRRILGGCRWC